MLRLMALLVLLGFAGPSRAYDLGPFVVGKDCRENDALTCVAPMVPKPDDGAIGQILADSPDLQAAYARCRAGQSGFCYTVGDEIWRTGYEYPVNRDQGAALLAPLCDRGMDAACRIVGSYLFDRYEGAVRGELIVQLSRRSCAAYNIEACNYWASDLWQGTYVSQDKEAGIAIWMDACLRHDVDSCLYAAYNLQRDGTTFRDPFTALRLADIGCELGSEDACLMGAEMALTFAELDEGRDGALVRLEIGCSDGGAAACLRGSNLHLHGSDGPDFAGALPWL